MIDETIGGLETSLQIEDWHLFYFYYLAYYISFLIFIY